MHLNKLKSYYFRAFGDSAPIRFSAQLTIFYGGNGAGKSSFAEAMEWLFYGYTKRRRKGENYSKNEYKDSYINIGCPEGIIPFVEAEITYRDGTIHTIKRMMKKDERERVIESETQLFIDGVEVPDFLALDISSDAQCPVVVQHGIQDFIHTRPIDRYRTISEALGLADLTKFKDLLEKAKGQFQRNPPQKVTAAKQALKQSAKELEKIQLGDIARHWQKKEPEPSITDFQAIEDKAREFTSSQAEGIEDLLKEVREHQTLEISKLFDSSPFKPSANQEVVLQEVLRELADLSREGGNLLVVSSELAQTIVMQYSEMQLEFWRQGLELLQQNPALDQSSQDEKFECPFCEEETISQKKLGIIQIRSTSGKDLDEKRKRLSAPIGSLLTLVTTLETTLPKIEFSLLPEEKIAALKRMFSRGEKQLDAFIVGNRECALELGTIRVKVGELKTILNGLQNKKLSPEDAVKSIEPVNILIGEIVVLLPKAGESLRKFSKTFIEFQPILQRELSDEATVAVFTSLINLLMVKPQFDLLLQVQSFDAEILRAQQKADNYILDRQKEMVKKREDDILVWYGLLSPNPDVKFTGLVPGKDEYNLKATAFGRELNAAASLSQSQLNCLGLSVYIPSIVAPESPFDFVVFDDPVQAMDDEHHESFLIKVLPELLNNRKRQVIILTHLKVTADRLRNLNYECNPLYYKFDKLTQSGPKIKEYIVFKDEIDQVRDLAESNEESRKLAVDRIRVLCEVIMRESHIRITGTMMPDKAQNPRQMFQVFRKIQGVSVGNAKNLEDAIGWADKAHHTDPNWQVPEGNDIKIHLERLQSIISTLGLRSEKE